MADLRTRFIEDYAGGLLNIARQELSSTGEVLAQDGFVEGTSLFVEDGRGVKSGLRLGSSLAECIDPTTETGILNVRSADRTYAKIRDLKIFATAVASAQGALSESVAESFTNLEGAFESLESDVELFRNRLDNLSDIQVTLADGDRGDITVSGLGTVWNIDDGAVTYQKIQNASTNNVILGRYDTGSGVFQEITLGLGLSLSASGELTSSGGSELQGRATAQNTLVDLPNDNTAIQGKLDIASVAKSYLLLKIETSAAAWVTLYTDSASRTADETRNEITDPLPGSGVIAEVITTEAQTQIITPGVVGWNNEATPTNTVYAKVVNKSGATSSITVTLTYIALK